MKYFISFVSDKGADVLGFHHRIYTIDMEIKSEDSFIEFQKFIEKDVGCPIVILNWKTLEGWE